MIMSIEEKAKEYTNGKALEAINAAIEKAYVAGYNDGMRHTENEKLDAIKDGVEFVDLGLPSGTLWSSICVSDGSNPRLFPYIEASKLSIPTKEQYKELIYNCKRQDYFGDKRILGVFLIGKTGRKITIPFVKIDEISRLKHDLFFWLKDDSESDEKDSAAEYHDTKVESFKTKKVFMGYKLPIMLVKNL